MDQQPRHTNLKPHGDNLPNWLAKSANTLEYTRCSRFLIFSTSYHIRWIRSLLIFKKIDHMISYCKSNLSSIQNINHLQVTTHSFTNLYTSSKFIAFCVFLII